MDQNKWDARFIKLAALVASWSKDPSTKCGAVIAEGNRVVSIGFNGYPSGIEDNVNDDRETKLAKTIHAEVNAILHAHRDLYNCTIYTYPFQPCASCASVIVQSGISRVVAGIPNNIDMDRWLRSFGIAEKAFYEAYVKLEKVIL